MAQEWNLDWGGYYNMDVLYNDTSGNFLPSATDLDGVSIHQNGEIHFTPNVTLDNGMTFGVVVEMEAANNGGGADGIDESYMYIESDAMGRIEVGSENSAGYKLSTGAPSVGFGINSPSPTAFHPTAFLPGFGTNPGAITAANPLGVVPQRAAIAGTVFTPGFTLGRNAMGSSFTEVAGNNDTARISYYTPSFNGLTLGVSYAPGNTNVSNSGLVNRNAAPVSDIFDIGANYSQTFGNVDVTLSARWGTGDAGVNQFISNVGADGIPGTADDVMSTNPAGPDGVLNTIDDLAPQVGDPETWAIGARFGVAGFTFGGSYAENDSGVQFGVGDTEGWSLGVTYDLAGPWTVGFDTYQGEMTGARSGANNQFTSKSEYEAYQIGAERELGAGVAWRIYAIQSETSVSSTNPNPFGVVAPALAVNKYSTKSTAVGTGIRLNF